MEQMMSMTPEQKSEEQPEVLKKNVIYYEPIFPVLMAKINLELPVEDMARDLLQMESDKNYSGGFTTFFNNQSIDHIAGYQQLKEAIYGVCLSFAQEQKYEVDPDRCAIWTWASIMRKGGYHQEHNHPRSHFSGTFYIKRGSSSAPIILTSPTMPFRMHEPPITNPENYGPFTSPSLNLTPEDNTMLIWPSWLHHQVPQIMDDEPRIAISFNVDYMPQGA
jgi:uncharacterized protein (TIGR02466 family)